MLGQPPDGMWTREAYSYRSDAAVPRFPDDKPIIIFDGHCALCSGFARFVLKHDKDGVFRLLPAQTPVGTALYVHYGLDPKDYETNILLDSGCVWLKSEGTIRMFERLGLPWSLAAVWRLLPRALRDRQYEFVARNRFRWFGARGTCLMSVAGYEDRFLK